MRASYTCDIGIVQHPCAGTYPLAPGGRLELSVYTSIIRQPTPPTDATIARWSRAAARPPRRVLTFESLRAHDAGLHVQTSVRYGWEPLGLHDPPRVRYCLLRETECRIDADLVCGEGWLWPGPFGSDVSGHVSLPALLRDYARPLFGPDARVRPLGVVITDVTVWIVAHATVGRPPARRRADRSRARTRVHALVPAHA